MIGNIYKSFRGICVITLGSKGAIATNGNILFEIKTEPKKDAKDSTGAGDAFGSAFTTGIILKNDIEYGLQLGVANSRSVLTSIGAKNGLLKKIPTRFEYKITNNKL
jgi:sugar/nucleoside kinase (ribokinase family)